MDWASDELVRVFYNLLPGFLSAWIFYALTAHPKPSPFERIVQALIFTVIVRATTIVTLYGFSQTGAVHLSSACRDSLSRREISKWWNF